MRPPGAQNGHSANLEALAAWGQSVELAAVRSGPQLLEDLIAIADELRDHVGHQVWEGSEKGLRPSAGTARPATGDGEGDIVVLPVGIEQI